MMIRHI